MSKKKVTIELNTDSGEFDAEFHDRFNVLELIGISGYLKVYAEKLLKDQFKEKK